MRINFREIAYYPKKSGKCVVCGKQAARREKIYSTVNPFNRNADGSIKTPEEVAVQVRAEVRDWMNKPIKHAKCES